MAALAGRASFNYSENRSAAYVPSILCGSGSLKAPVENCLRSLPQVSLNLLHKLRDDIRNHAEMRIQLFLQQLLLTFRSGIVHAAKKADWQIGKGKADYAAAHSSTLPSLKSWIYTEEAVFCKGSRFYDDQNLTILLPKVVNAIDMDLDQFNRKLGVDQALRTVAVAILNAVSCKDTELTPKVGLMLFLDAFIRMVGCAAAIRAQQRAGIDRPEYIERLDQELFILNCYYEVAASYQDRLAKDDQMIRTFCYLPTAGVVDHQFYQTIQSQMLTVLAQEIGGHWLTERAVSPLPAITAVEYLPQVDEKESLFAPDQAIIQALSRTKTLGRTASSYVSMCRTAKNVRRAARRYLAGVDLATLQKDLSILPSIKTFKTRENFSLSPGLAALWQEVRSLVGKDPRGIGAILMNLLLI